MNITNKVLIVNTVAVFEAALCKKRDMKASHLLLDWCFVPLAEHERDAYKGSASARGAGVRHLLEIGMRGNEHYGSLLIESNEEQRVLDEGQICELNSTDEGSSSTGKTFMMCGRKNRRWIFGCGDIRLA